MVTCLCLDFGGSSVKYALVDSTGEISETGKRDAPLDSPEQFVDTVAEIVELYQPNIQGVSICVPGYVDPDTGVLQGSGAYINLWGLSIRDLVAEAVSVPVAVENDGKCGALSESWLGALAGTRTGAVVILGTGLGGGIVTDGRVHHGRGPWQASSPISPRMQMTCRPPVLPTTRAERPAWHTGPAKLEILT